MRAICGFLAGVMACAGPMAVKAQDAPHADEQTSAAPQKVLVVLAHPDDEITMAPALSRLARGGADITLAFATSGDAGPGSSGLEPGDELAALREGEGRCSAKALGLKEPKFWRLGDGTLGIEARKDGSAAKRALALTALAIAEARPQVIMTWGPDGGYGHSDHRMVSSLVTQVVQSMVKERPILLYTAIPQTEVEGLPGFEQWARTPPDLVTDMYGYGTSDLEATAVAVNCYKSQFPTGARALLTQVLHDQIWRGENHFRRAFVQSTDQPANRP